MVASSEKKRGIVPEADVSCRIEMPGGRREPGQDEGEGIFRQLEAIKRIGRIAYHLAKGGDLVGAVMREGEKKYLRQRDEGWLLIDLVTPHPRSTDPQKFLRNRTPRPRPEGAGHVGTVPASSRL